MQTLKPLARQTRRRHRAEDQAHRVTFFLVRDAFRSQRSNDANFLRAAELLIEAQRRN
jgi:hypothetical protein